MSVNHRDTFSEFARVPEVCLLYIKRFQKLYILNIDFFKYPL